MTAGVALAPAAGAQTQSSDASLSSLSFESDLRQTRMFPAFRSDVTRYDVAVPSGETEVTVKLQTRHPGASVEVRTTPQGRCCIVSLEADANTAHYALAMRTDRDTYVRIDVTAEDGTEKEYAVSLNVASLDAQGWRVYNDVPLDRLVDDPALPSHHLRGAWAGDVDGVATVLTTSWELGPDFDQNLYAFNAADSSRRTTDDFVLSGSPNAGIWSDGTTLWAMDTHGSLRAYDLSDGSYKESHSTDVSPGGSSGNRDVDGPRGIWSDGSTLWVVDADNNKVFAFGLPGVSCTNFNKFCRQSSKDLELHSDNGNPWGIAANADTWWVSDIIDDKIYAYNRSDGTRDPDKDIDFRTTVSTVHQVLLYGLSSTDTILYAAEYITNRVYSFNMSDVTAVAPSLISSDATLSSLTAVDDSSTNVPLTPTFSFEHTGIYQGNVEPDVTSVTVTATPNDSSASAVVKVGGTVASGGVVSLSDGDNAIDVEVTAQDGTKKTYRLNVNRRALSTDATLSNLELSDVPFNFQSGTYTYRPAAVANSVGETTVVATPSDSRVESVVIKHNGDVVDADSDGDYVVALNAQEVDDPVVNTVTVEVTAEDGVTSKTYTVTVTRNRALSDNAMLNDLVLMYGEEEADLTPGFAVDEYSYTTNLAHGVTSILVKFEKGDTNQTVALKAGGAKDGNGDVANESPLTIVEGGTPLDLDVGVNTLTIDVTAENGIATQSYEVSITRAAASNVATLESLSLDPGTLNEAFLPSTALYTASVLHDEDSTVVEYVKTDDTATVLVKVGGTVGQDDTVTGGTEADSQGSVELAVGSNTVTVEVTAQDAQTKNLYVITVTRPAEPDSTDATLGTLELTNPKNSLAVDLDDAFSAGDTHYTAAVGNDVTQVKVVAKPADPDAESVQLQVDGADAPNGDRAGLADGVTVNLAEPTVATVLTIKVTAEDGNATETYTIVVTRSPPPLRGVTTLDSLVLRDLTQTPVTLDPEFVQGALNKTSFTTSVDHGVAKLEVIAKPTDADGATVAVTVGGTVGQDGTITGGTDADEGGFVPLDVVGGSGNVIRVVVTAQNGTDTETYTVTVTRGEAPANDIATLSSLTLSNATINFQSDTETYTASVLNGVDSTTVRAVATSANASLTAALGSIAATSTGSVTLDVGLAVGPNAISVEVTAEDGQTTKTYTVTVTRAGPPPSNTGGNTNTGNTGNTGGNTNTGNTGSNTNTGNTGNAVGRFSTSVGGTNTGSSGADDGSETTQDDSDSETTQDDSGSDTTLEDLDDADADHRADINELHGLGVFAGTLCGTNRLCPDKAMARWIAAVWLVRLIDGGDPAPVTETRFADVNASEMWEQSMWFAPHVERLAELEITVGCTEDPLNFCPDVMLRKAQVASWLARAFDLPSASSQSFVDAVGSAHEDNINKVVAAGVMEGCSSDPKNFCLDDNVTRGEMASYVNKARKVTSS